MGDMSNEPSMEDILSSIKRIIAEDTDAALSPPRGRRAVGASAARELPVAGDEDEVLELTEAVPADETPVTEAGENVANVKEPAAEISEPAVLPVQTSAAPLKPNAAAVGKPALVSEATITASRGSIAALSALVVKPEVVGSDTLEGLVREMLKPMLADWLDERLPEVVERLVAQEIARITARG